MLHGKHWTLAYVTDVKGHYTKDHNGVLRYPNHSRQWKWQNSNWGLNWTFATFIWNATEGQRPMIILKTQHIKSGKNWNPAYRSVSLANLTSQPIKTQNPSPTCNSWNSHFLPMFSAQIPNITTQKRLNPVSRQTCSTLHSYLYYNFHIQFVKEIGAVP